MGYHIAPQRDWLFFRADHDLQSCRKLLTNRSTLSRQRLCFSFCHSRRESAFRMPPETRSRFRAGMTERKAKATIRGGFKISISKESWVPHPCEARVGNHKRWWQEGYFQSGARLFYPFPRSPKASISSARRSHPFCQFVCKADSVRSASPEVIAAIIFSCSATERWRLPRIALA